MSKAQNKDCTHRYLTAFEGSGGWVCADCRVPVPSPFMPPPRPLSSSAIDAAVVGRALPPHSPHSQD
jgi:hypothetical protein